MAIVLSAGTAHLAWQAYRLNFDPRLVADPRNPYVYAHTPMGLPRLTDQLERLRQQMPDGRTLTVHTVIKENYWPLPWYLRKFPPGTVGYWLDADQWQKEHLRHIALPDVVIISCDFDLPELEARLAITMGKESILCGRATWCVFTFATNSGRRFCAGETP